MTTESTPSEPLRTSVAPGGQPTSGSPQAAVEALTAAAARLHAELEAASEDGARALVLHEMAVLLERAGDDPGAARDYLAAFNADPELREPLEALVALLHRRRSVKNLGKLLEALGRAATSNEEAARALVERAAFVLEQQADAALAKSILGEAVVEAPDDLTAWLELEILAGKEGDLTARLDALTERAARAEPATWRALLLVDLAELQLASGDAEKAAATLRTAAQPESGARFRAYVALGDLARRERSDALLAESCEAQAALVIDAIENPEHGDALGVPSYVRTPVFVADAWIRAAEARRRSGDDAGAAALLDGAASKLPAEPVIVSLQLASADAAGDGEKSAALARRLLELGASGAEAASLWMRIEEDAAGRGDRDGAIAALASAVETDPACVPARALQLDFLSLQDGEKDGAALASSLEAAAELLESDGAKGRSYLRAAWEWAALAHDASGAKAALSQAGALGVPPATLSRVARALAALTKDVTWYEEATRRLIAAKPSEAEVVSLWLELARARLVRRDVDGAIKALDAMAALPGGAWIGRTLSAYVLPLVRPVEEPVELGAAALDVLAQAESDPLAARALTTVAAVRALRAGDKDGAATRLRELLDKDAGDPVAAAFLSQLLRSSGDDKGASAVLSAAAGACEDPALAGAFFLEAGLALWPLGARREALDAFRAARAAAPAAAAPLLSWAMRAVDPDTVASRREALELATEAGENPALVALERFGLEVGAAGDVEDARAALETLEKTSEGSLALAAALARATWQPVVGDRDSLGEALTKIERTSKGGALIAHAERTRIARDYDENKVDYARHAAAWASTDPSVGPALEWLAATAAIEDREGEAAAHRLLASHLTGEARAAEETAATALSWLTGLGGVPTPVHASEPVAQLLNLEMAPAGCDPRRRTLALRGMASGALGDEAALDALALAGWSDLAAGDASAALAAFRKVVEVRADDLVAWEGVRSAASVIGDAATTALACARLGELCKDDARAAGFWEQAGVLWIDLVNDPAHGEEALVEAFTRDPRRALAFDKLFRRLRARDADDALLELTTRRLAVAEDTTEIAKLYWEQARVLRKKGDYEASLEALSNVTMLEPDHVGALALSGEVFIKQGAFEEAAEALSRLAALKEAPAQQRLISGVAAVDLYEKKLQRIDRALDVLVALHRAGLSTLPVRERLAGIAAKAGAWEDATGMLEELMNERETADGRVAAARLSMAIWRDKRRDPKGARRAVTKLLAEAPGDGEALDLLLDNQLKEPWANELVRVGRGTLVSTLARGKLDADTVARLAKIARAADDPGLLQATLGVLVTLGRDEPGIAEELADLDQRVARVPQIQIDARVLAAIGDPDDQGPLTKLFELLGETIAEALGPSKDALGVGRKERIDPRSGLPLRNDVAAWAGALGLGEFELYIGGRDPNGVQGVAGEVPALVIGPAITSPLTAAARQAIAREIFALRRGITVVRTRDEATVASIAIAACNLVEVRLDAPAFAILGDVQRQLGRALPRKVKKVLPEVCNEVAASRADVRAWASASGRSLDRMATVAAGDVSLVLSDVCGVPRAELKRAAVGNDRAERLLRFVLSPNYLELRTRLGMGVR